MNLNIWKDYEFEKYMKNTNMQVLLHFILFRGFRVFFGKYNSAIDSQAYCIHGANFALLAIVKS